MSDLVSIVKARLEHAQKALICANGAAVEGKIITMMRKLGEADGHIHEASSLLGDPSVVIDDETLAVLQASFEKASFKVRDAEEKIAEIGCRNAVLNGLRNAENASDPFDARWELSYACFALRFLKNADDLGGRVKNAEAEYHNRHVSPYLASALQYAEKGDVAGMESQLNVALENGSFSDVSGMVMDISRLGFKNALFDRVKKAEELSLMKTDDVRAAVQRMEECVSNARLYAKRFGKSVDKKLREISLAGYRNALNIAVGMSESTEGDEQTAYLEFAQYCSKKIRETSD